MYINGINEKKSTNTKETKISKSSIKKFFSLNINLKNNNKMSKIIFDKNNKSLLYTKNI